MSVRLQLFGVLRSRFGKNELILELNSPCRLSDLKERLEADFSDCAFGNETSLLLNDSIIDPGDSIAVMPPVCGG